MASPWQSAPASDCAGYGGTNGAKVRARGTVRAGVGAFLLLAATVSACSGSPPAGSEESPTAVSTLEVNRRATEGLGEPVSVPPFPDAESTGVRAGVTLRSTDGSIRVTENGTVIEARHVRGRIIIAADNVTVRNTLVETGTDLYPIQVLRGTTGTLIEHVEVDNSGGAGLGIFFQGPGTVRHADIHSADDGIRIQSDNVTVEHSYIHDLHRQPGGHHDSIQIRRGDNITIRDNNLQAYVAATDDPMNAALQLGSLSGDDLISDLVVTGNLMNGGNYTINAGRGIVDSALYADNRFGRDYRHGAVASLSENAIWEDTNVWHDTGTPVR